MVPEPGWTATPGCRLRVYVACRIFAAGGGAVQHLLCVRSVVRVALGASVYVYRVATPARPRGRERGTLRGRRGARRVA